MKSTCLIRILANVFLITAAVFLFFDFTPLDLLPKNRNLRAAIYTLESENYLIKDLPGAQIRTADGRMVSPKPEAAAAAIDYIKDHIGTLPWPHSWDRVAGAMLRITPPTETNLATLRIVDLIILPRTDAETTVFPPALRLEDLKDWWARDHQRRIQQTIGFLLAAGFIFQWLGRRKKKAQSEN